MTMKTEPNKVNTMSKKPLSTFEREMQDPHFKAAYEESYQELLLSELLISIMELDEKSVRKLAKEAGLSPTIIQNLRSGKQRDIKIGNFVNIAKVLGYKVILEKGDERFVAEENKEDKKQPINFIPMHAHH